MEIGSLKRRSLAKMRPKKSKASRISMQSICNPLEIFFVKQKLWYPSQSAVQVSNRSFQNPFHSSKLLRVFPSYNAATNAAPNPSIPPIPAIIAGAAFALLLAGAGAPKLLLLDDVLDALLPVAALLVVAGTLVVIAVTLVVETGVEDVVFTTPVEAPEVVVRAETEASDAENFEQRPKPTDAAMLSSD